MRSASTLLASLIFGLPLCAQEAAFHVRGRVVDESGMRVQNGLQDARAAAKRPCLAIWSLLFSRLWMLCGLFTMAGPLFCQCACSATTPRNPP